MRLLAFLLLLPLAALGQTHYPVADGLWTNAATWSAGTVPDFTSTVAITGYVVTVDRAVQAGTLTVSGGRLFHASNAAYTYTSNTVTITGGVVGSASGGGLLPITARIDATGGTLSNTTIWVTAVGGGRTSTPVVASTVIGSVGMTFEGAGWTVIVSNQTFKAALNVASGTVIVTNSVWTANRNSNLPGRTTISDSTVTTGGAMVLGAASDFRVYGSTIKMDGSVSGSGFSGTASNFVAQSSAIELVAGPAATTVLRSDSFSISNSTLTLRGISVARLWNVTWPNGLLVTTNTAGSLNTFSTGVECGALTMSSNGPANWATGGYSLTVTGTARTAGTLSMSNSTMFVRDLLNSGVVSQQTSTVSLLAGDNIISNVPRLFNAVKYTAGTARITTNLAVTGTLEFQSGANLDAGGSVVGLANPSTIGGNLQSGTITGNVLRVDGIADKSSGQLNTPRMGRR